MTLTYLQLGGLNIRWEYDALNWQPNFIFNEADWLMEVLIAHDKIDEIDPCYRMPLTEVLFVALALDLGISPK